MAQLGIKRINFIEYNAKINTLGSLVPIFPKYGSLLLASLMRDMGYEVRYFLEGISPMGFEVITDADVICLSVFAPALTKARALGRMIMQRKPGLPVIMGGPQVCYFTDTVLDCCTYAVRTEGDEVLPRLIQCLNSGGDVQAVPGISFRQDGHIVHNPTGPAPRIPATIPDVSLIQGFAQATSGLFGGWLVNTLQTTRGCRFRCNFCPTERLFQGSYRSRDIESVIADIKAKLTYSNIFFAVDNDFCSDRTSTKALLERLIHEDLDLQLIIFERHEIGRDGEMLDLLKQAGVKVVIVGVESLIDKSLKAFNKRQTNEQVIQSIRNITASGMNVLSTFVLGYDEDTPASAMEMADFVIKNHLIMNLFILHDLEDDENRDLLIPKNRRFMTHYAKTDPNNLDFWDYMTGSFVTYFPKRMKPSTLQRLIFDINERVFAHANILKDMFAADLFRSYFGIFFGYAMKRINRNLARFAAQGYIAYLERIEDNLYDEREELIEEKLSALNGLPLPPVVKGYKERQAFWIITALAMIPSGLRYPFQSWGERHRSA
ncbi:MAG: radical SAM protein [Syntrophaceae bacterium]